MDANVQGCPEVTKTIYLANPYGFSAQQKMMLLPPIVSALEELGLEVWEPFARNNQVDFLETGWAYRIGQRDFEDVAAADAIFAVVNGVPPDEGVMVELGMAVALHRSLTVTSRRKPSSTMRIFSSGVYLRRAAVLAVRTKDLVAFVR